MPNRLTPDTNANLPMVYQIRLKGQLGAQWATWFEGLTITLVDDGDTLMTGIVVDQAALHGLLRTIRDLGLPLLAVTRIDPDQSADPDVPSAS